MILDCCLTKTIYRLARSPSEIQTERVHRPSFRLDLCVALAIVGVLFTDSGMCLLQNSFSCSQRFFIYIIGRATHLYLLSCPSLPQDFCGTLPPFIWSLRICISLHCKLSLASTSPFILRPGDLLGSSWRMWECKTSSGWS